MDFVTPAVKSQPPEAQGLVLQVSKPPSRGSRIMSGMGRVMPRDISYPKAPVMFPGLSMRDTGKPEPSLRRTEGVDQRRWWQDTCIYSLTKAVRRSCLVCERGGEITLPLLRPSMHSSCSLGLALQRFLVTSTPPDFLRRPRPTDLPRQAHSQAPCLPPEVPFAPSARYL